MKTFRASTCCSLFLLLTSALPPAAAQVVTLDDLFNGQTITADDKVFTDWTPVETLIVNNAFADPAKVDVTPLVDDPLNPGVKFTADFDAIGTPFGHTGPSSVIFTFSFKVSTVTGAALIKDNSLRINDWLFDSGPNAIIKINETVLNVAGGTIGDKQVEARPGQQPPDLANPAHFDDLNFAPQSSLTIFKRIEVNGPELNDGARLLMFEQRFSQIPEPAGLASATWAGLAIFGFRRGRLSKVG